MFILKYMDTPWTLNLTHKSILQSQRKGIDLQSQEANPTDKTTNLPRPEPDPTNTIQGLDDIALYSHLTTSFTFTILLDTDTK